MFAAPLKLLAAPFPPPPPPLFLRLCMTEFSYLSSNWQRLFPNRVNWYSLIILPASFRLFVHTVIRLCVHRSSVSPPTLFCFELYLFVHITLTNDKALTCRDLTYLSDLNKMAHLVHRGWTLEVAQGPKFKLL